MTTESRIDAANVQMAAVANDRHTPNKRERLRAIWQPVAFELIDTSFSSLDDAALARLTSEPTFVGLTCDTGRPVFLEKETSASGYVYRKFVVGDRPSTN